MTTFVYATRSRPAGYATVPDNWSTYQQPDSIYPYGLISYAEKLTDEDIYHYELYRVSENARRYIAGQYVIYAGTWCKVTNLLPWEDLELTPLESIEGVETVTVSERDEQLKPTTPDMYPPPCYDWTQDKKSLDYKALRWVDLATPKDDNRPILNNIHFVNEYEPQAVATDAYRMHIITGADVSKWEAGETGYILSRYQIRRGEPSANAGRFPDFSSIIPRHMVGYTKLVMNTKATAKVFTAFKKTTKDHKYRVTFVIAKGEPVRLEGYETVNSLDKDDWTLHEHTFTDVRLEVCNPMQASLNVSYLVDAIKYHSKALRSTFTLYVHPGKPALLEYENNGLKHQAVIMPMLKNR